MFKKSFKKRLSLEIGMERFEFQEIGLFLLAHLEKMNRVNNMKMTNLNYLNIQFINYIFLSRSALLNLCMQLLWGLIAAYKTFLQ